MADSEKYHLLHALEGFDERGHVDRLPHDVASRLVRLLGQQGYERAGGVLPLDSLRNKDDTSTRSSRLEMVRTVKDAPRVIGPYVIPGEGEEQDAYYLRGAMIYTKQ